MIKKVLKENYIYFICLFLIIIIFSIIMRSSLHEKILLFDYKIINVVNKIVNNKLTYGFRLLTNFGDIYIPIIILVCIFVFFKNKWFFILQSSSYAFAGLITLISKLLAARPRPVEALIKIPKSYSFPSGHTLTSIVFYVMLIYILSFKIFKNQRKKLLIIMFLFSLCIAFSRIYLGVHYFSDILGGLIISIPCLLLLINIINKNFKDKLY